MLVDDAVNQVADTAESTESTESTAESTESGESLESADVETDAAESSEPEQIETEATEPESEESATADPMAPELCQNVPDNVVIAVLGEAPVATEDSRPGIDGCLWQVGDNRLVLQTGTTVWVVVGEQVYAAAAEVEGGSSDPTALVDVVESVIG